MYKELSKDKVKAFESLISEVAFIKIQLEILKINIMQNGLTELFEQGSQCFERERPQAKLYISLIQRYSTLMKQLIDLMPEEEREREQDALALFLLKKRSNR